MSSSTKSLDPAFQGAGQKVYPLWLWCATYHYNASFIKFDLNTKFS